MVLFRMPACRNVFWLLGERRHVYCRNPPYYRGTPNSEAMDLAYAPFDPSAHVLNPRAKWRDAVLIGSSQIALDPSGVIVASEDHSLAKEKVACHDQLPATPAYAQTAEMALLAPGVNFPPDPDDGAEILF